MLSFNAKKLQLGYSLIELVITITLTSIVMVIFFTVFSQNQKNSATPVMQVKAAQLAQAYMEEISLKRFDENSPSGNNLRCGETSAPACSVALGPESESRNQFDDIDDYNGLSDFPPVDALNNVRAGFDNFGVTVNVAYAGTDFGLPNQNLKRITVTVTVSNNDTFVFTQYKGNF